VLRACASAAAEAEQLASLVAAARVEAGRGTSRVWISTAQAPGAADGALRLALAVAMGCEGLSVVAAGLAPGSWLRLAEDAATADGLCGGRLELAFARLPDSSLLERLRLAWSGAPVEANAGSLVEIHPRPARPGGPALWSVVSSEAEAIVAAGLELGVIAEDPVSARACPPRPPLAPPVALIEAAPPGRSHDDVAAAEDWLLLSRVDVR